MINKDRSKRIAAAAAGAALAYYGFKKGGAGGMVMGVMGAGLATSNLRSATGIPARLADEARQVVEVKASPKVAFDVWSQFENFPRFMQNVIEVNKTGERAWRLAYRSPFGQRVEGKIELIAIHPERYIAWRMTSPGLSGRGEVRFEPAPGGARVMAVIEREQSGGPISEMLAAVTGKSPKAALKADLKRFKKLVEDSVTA
ncbi:MAG TPA: SRPBCC family protein [Blastocatellia bacterium]|nr:SRPBCC family protein [Blastocatellia bacterium]